MKNLKSDFVLREKTPMSHNGIDATSSNSSPSINIKGLPEEVTVKELLDVESQISSLPECAFKFTYSKPKIKTAEEILQEVENEGK